VDDVVVTAVPRISLLSIVKSRHQHCEDCPLATRCDHALGAATLVKPVMGPKSCGSLWREPAILQCATSAIILCAAR
jgi:hypothetical protein